MRARRASSCAKMRVQRATARAHALRHDCEAAREEAAHDLRDHEDEAEGHRDNQLRARGGGRARAVRSARVVGHEDLL
jgi:hypothetical protein